MRFQKCATLLLGTLSAWSFLTTAQASGLKPVKALPGYQCMAIDAPDEVMMDDKHPIMMHQQPNDKSPEISGVPTVFAVTAPAEVKNGYIKTINFGLQPGWVSTKWVKPYETVHPGVKCIPSIMTDGKLGFDFPRN